MIEDRYTNKYRYRSKELIMRNWLLVMEAGKAHDLPSASGGLGEPQFSLNVKAGKP